MNVSRAVPLLTAALIFATMQNAGASKEVGYSANTNGTYYLMCPLWGPYDASCTRYSSRVIFVEQSDLNTAVARLNNSIASRIEIAVAKKLQTQAGDANELHHLESKLLNDPAFIASITQPVKRTLNASHSQ